MALTVLRTLLFGATLLSLAHADLGFTSPLAGDVIDGTEITWSWEPTGVGPNASNIACYDIYLCAGGNKPQTYVRQPH
jgi:hypothetical protein